MKIICLSIVLCLGFTMMGYPVQTPNDNVGGTMNSDVAQSVADITKRPVDNFRYKGSDVVLRKVKRIDTSKLEMSKQRSLTRIQDVHSSKLKISSNLKSYAESCVLGEIPCRPKPPKKPTGIEDINAKY